MSKRKRYSTVRSAALDFPITSKPMRCLLSCWGNPNLLGYE